MNTNLKISNVTKIYPGCVANDNVSLEFNSGKIYALLGENGAGKSTLVKIYQASSFLTKVKFI